MQKLFWFIGASAGGWAGWALGEPFGIMAAAMGSAVGTGLGIYIAHKLIADHF